MIYIMKFNNRVIGIFWADVQVNKSTVKDFFNPLHEYFEEITSQIDALEKPYPVGIKVLDTIEPTQKYNITINGTCLLEVDANKETAKVIFGDIIDPEHELFGEVTDTIMRIINEPVKNTGLVA